MATTEGDVTSTQEEEDKEDVQTGSLVTQSLPHAYDRGALTLDVETIKLDGSELGERGELDEDDRHLSLVDENGWETLELAGEVRLDLETIKHVFPPNEFESPPGRLALVETDRLAIYRGRTILQDSPVEAETVPFNVEIERKEHRGTVELTPFLTRSETRGSRATNHASKVGARLADGPSWTLHLDRRDDQGGLLVPIIEDFEDSDRFPDENHVHYLSLEEPRNPQLYLNSDHPQVVNVLQNEGATGGPPRLRDVLYDYIEHSVWTQLIIQTARDTDPDTGEPSHSWQEDVHDLFLDRLYPDMDEKEASTQLANDIRSVEDLPALVQNIERAVHQQYDIPTDVKKLIEEAIQNDD